MITTKKLFCVLGAVLLQTLAFAQVGIGTTSPANGAILDLTATNKALLLTRVVHVDLITFPINGMIVYDELNNCVRAFENGSWCNCFNIAESTNGTGIVSSYTSTTFAGTMTVGTAVSAVTQTITATVLRVGTYNISATANGVTFAGSGTFTATGAQTIVLTASGTPTIVLDVTYKLNTQPNCSFMPYSSSTNGKAIVSAYTYSSSAGVVKVGTPVSGVTQTWEANVSRVGDYSLTATANGVTFAASGTFTTTGLQPVVLTASGTPEVKGSFAYPLNTTTNNVSSIFSTVTGCYANVGGTIKDFLCYNLGVSTTLDPFTYQEGNNNGDLYQWGRTTDGHQLRNSLTTPGPTGAVANRFITIPATNPLDWGYQGATSTAWGDGTSTSLTKSLKDPCPAGFMIPNEQQWIDIYGAGTTNLINDATNNIWTWTGNGFTVGNYLYLPAAGMRNLSEPAALDVVGTRGYYWNSVGNVPSSYGKMLFFKFDRIYPSIVGGRATGMSIRCISE